MNLILLEFILEKTVTNIVPILIGVILFRWLLNILFTNKISTIWLKTLMYSVVGSLSGIWAYATFDIPDRPLEIFEFITLFLGMTIINFILIGVIILIKSKLQGSFERLKRNRD